MLSKRGLFVFTRGFLLFRLAIPSSFLRPCPVAAAVPAAIREICFSRAQIVVYTAFNIRVAPATSFIQANAGIAQLVEQLICNQQVVGSNPTAGLPYEKLGNTPTRQ